MRDSSKPGRLTDNEWEKVSFPIHYHRGFVMHVAEFMSPESKYLSVNQLNYFKKEGKKLLLHLL